MIFTPEDRALGRARGGGRAARWPTAARNDERWHQRKDGSRFWANGALMRMNDAAGEPVGFVKILRDETAARETRQALEQGRADLWAALQETERARAEAEAAGAGEGPFPGRALARTAHAADARDDGRPPARAPDADLPESAREALDMIRRNVQIEAHCIDDLLDVTRITHGKLEVVREPMDLHAAVRGAVEVTAAELARKRGQRADGGARRGGEPVAGAIRTGCNRCAGTCCATPRSSRRRVGRSRCARAMRRARCWWKVSDTGIGFDAGRGDAHFRAVRASQRGGDAGVRRVGAGAGDFQGQRGRARRRAACPERRTAPGSDVHRGIAAGGESGIVGRAPHLPREGAEKNGAAWG